MVEDIPKVRAGGNSSTQHYGIEHLQNIKTYNNMIDIWQKQHPTKKPLELMEPWKKMTQTKLKTYLYLLIPFDPLTAHKTDILIKQLLCQFEGLLVF